MSANFKPETENVEFQAKTQEPPQKVDDKQIPSPQVPSQSENQLLDYIIHIVAIFCFKLKKKMTKHLWRNRFDLLLVAHLVLNISFN